MQVNRLSLGLQEQLKIASNFNTARSDSLFQYQAATAATAGSGVAPNTGTSAGKKDTDFSKLDTKDLNISSDEIGGLLAGFSDEVIKVFSSDILLDNPLRKAPTGEEGGTQGNSPIFTA